MDDQTFLNLIHRDPRVPVRFLSEDVQRRLAGVLDVSTSNGNYRHVANLLGYNTDQQMWIEQLQGNFQSPTLNLLALIQRDKPALTVQELVSVFHKLGQIKAIHVIKANWLDIQRLNGTQGGAAVRNSEPPDYAYSRQPVQHTEPVQEMPEFRARGSGLTQRRAQPTMISPQWDTADLLLQSSATSVAANFLVDKHAPTIYGHREGYPLQGQNFQKPNLAPTSPSVPGYGVPVCPESRPTNPNLQEHPTNLTFPQQRFPIFPGREPPNQKFPVREPTNPNFPGRELANLNFSGPTNQNFQGREPTNPAFQGLPNPMMSPKSDPIGQRRTPSPKYMEVDVKPKIEDMQPTSPHPAEYKLLQELYKQDPDETTPKVLATDPPSSRLDSESYKQEGVMDLGMSGSKLKVQSPDQWMDLNLQGPETVEYLNKRRPHDVNRYRSGDNYPPIFPGSYAGDQRYAQGFDQGGAEQHAPYDLSARVPPQGSTRPGAQQIRIKEEPMDQDQQQQQQQQQPIDYTQKGRASTADQLTVNVHVHVNHDGQVTHAHSTAQPDAEEDSKAFNRQSPKRNSYPLLKSPSSKSPSSSAKDPMLNGEFSKGQRHDVRVLITYAYDNKKHVQDVIRLAKCLQNNGFAVTMDQNELKMTEKQFLEKYERYHSRVVNKRDPETEEDSKLHTVQVYERMQTEFWKGPPSGRRKKVLCPLMFPTASTSHLPQWMVNLQSYSWPQDWRNLMFYISQPEKLVERARTMQTYDV